MTKELIFKLISKDKENLIKIGKAIKTDFEGILGYYIIFDKMPIHKALLKVSDDIVKEYKDKMEVWTTVYKELNS